MVKRVLWLLSCLLLIVAMVVAFRWQMASQMTDQLLLEQSKLIRNAPPDERVSLQLTQLSLGLTAIGMRLSQIITLLGGLVVFVLGWSIYHESKSDD